MDSNNNVFESLLKEQKKTNKKMNVGIAIGTGILVVGAIDIAAKLGALSIAADAVAALKDKVSGLFGGTTPENKRPESKGDDFEDVK